MTRERAASHSLNEQDRLPYPSVMGKKIRKVYYSKQRGLHVAEQVDFVLSIFAPPGPTHFVADDKVSIERLPEAEVIVRSADNSKTAEVWGLLEENPIPRT